MLTPSALTVNGVRGEWVVAQVRSRHEKSLAWKFLDADMAYCLPLRRSGLPIVPGYIFIASSQIKDDCWSLQRTHSASILSFIPVVDQKQLKSELMQIMHAITIGADFSFDFDFKPGQRCRVISGAYRGNEGEVDATGKHGRIFIYLTTLGQRVSVQCLVNQLEPI